MTEKAPFTVGKPWGEFRQFTDGKEPVTVKTLTVKKGASLSLQYHHKREEFWKVVSGNPTITVGEKATRAQPGDEFTIPHKAVHRIAAEEDDAVILEIARGEFDENDIVRLEDKYARS